MILSTLPYSVNRSNLQRIKTVQQHRNNDCTKPAIFQTRALHLYDSHQCLGFSSVCPTSVWQLACRRLLYIPTYHTNKQEYQSPGYHAPSGSN